MLGELPQAVGLGLLIFSALLFGPSIFLFLHLIFTLALVYPQLHISPFVLLAFNYLGQ